MKNTGKVKEDEVAVASRVYEVGYLLVPTLSEDEVPALYGNLKELLVDAGGIAISDEMPKMTDLSYSMTKVVSNVRSKYDTAYFGWVKFEIDPESIESIKKNLDQDANVLRYIIVKTVRENTIAPKRFVGKESSRRKYSAKRNTEDETPIDKEVIDKEIDALVSEEE